MRHIYRFIFAFLSMSFICGCSNEDAPATAPDAHAGDIVFSPSISDQLTRAGVTTTENIQDFIIGCYNVIMHRDWTQYKFLMVNTPVKRIGANLWDYSPKVQWPDNALLDFFAISPAEGNQMQLNPWSGTYALTTGSDPKIDLVVCAKVNVTKSADPIPLNFVHAMARVQLRIAADVPGEEVYMTKAELINMRMGSLFFFPRVTTDSPTSADITNCWQYQKGTDCIAHSYYGRDASQPVLLTRDFEDYNNTGNQFEAPYPFRDLTVDSDVGGNYTGQAIRLTLKFVDSKTGKQTWPDNNTASALLPGGYGATDWGYVLFPLNGVNGMTTFESGKSYVFDITVKKHGALPPITPKDDNDTVPDTRAQQINFVPLPPGRYRSSAEGVEVSVAYY